MQPIPITILAGSDRAPASLPGSELHPLATNKGAEVFVGDRPMIAHLVEQIQLSGKFHPITIAGPADVYRPLNLDVRYVDTNADVGTNLKAGLDDHFEQHGDGLISVMALDVLLSAAEFNELYEMFHKEPPTSVWVPFVKIPEDKDELGAFGWKPSYPLIPAKGEPTIHVLPGHLGISRPKTLRLAVLYKIWSLNYESRNHSVAERRRTMIPAVLSTLLMEDLKSIRAFKVPRLTAAVVSNGLRIANQLRRKTLSIPTLEKAIEGIFVRPDSEIKKIRHPVVDMLSLAEDIDTEEEAAIYNEQLEKEILPSEISNSTSEP